MTNGIAYEVDQDLDDAAAFAIDRQRAGRFDGNADIARFCFLLEQSARFGGEVGQIEAIACAAPEAAAAANPANRATARETSLLTLM